MGAELRRCCVCKRRRPLAAFPTIVERKTRGTRVYEYVKPSYDCRECRNEQRRDYRRRKAEAAGKPFVPRGNRAAWELSRAAAREARKAERLAQYQRWLAEQQAASKARRHHLRTSASLTCSMCGKTKARREFYRGELTRCKACVCRRDAKKFQRDRASLSNGYIKRKLTNYTGLRSADIPPSLIEAKRAQLMLQRLVNPRRGKGQR